MHRTRNSKPIIAQYPLICLMIGLLIIFQIIWHFYMHEPWRESDITLETVQTILREGFSYQTNPMTGQPYTVGAPSRYKILLLPYIYALIVKVTGIAPQTVVWELVPVLVLLLSYFIYSRWAVYLFPDDRRKQCRFMLFVVLICQFGDYASVTDVFRIFHCGYEGTTIRAAVLLPLALLSCLKGRWWLAVLCALTEVCIVWTLYGLGYVFLIIAVVAAYRLLCHIVEKRRQAV